jgi:uroporphyrinogen decarboxylase
MEALRMTHKELGGRVPLIGFAGAPWTLLCYLIEGQGSRDFATAKAFCFEHPEAAQTLLQKLTDATVQYLQAQVAAGAQALQVFDSWANVLAPEDFRLLSLPSLRQIVQSGLGAPMILFARGAWHSLESLAATGADALSLDWTMDPLFARRTVGAQITLQGNLDPARLLSPPDKIHELTEAMIRRFGSHRYIANLGHGILPNTPVDHAKAFVEAVQSFED